jgi:hypothetical protein
MVALYLCWISWPFLSAHRSRPRIHLRGGQPAAKLPAAKTKNLFLRDPKSERLFLVVTPEECVDLKALAKAPLGSSG